MSPRIWLPAIGLLTAIAVETPAQEPARNTSELRLVHFQRGDRPLRGQSAQDMYEDIEVMRRLLVGRLTGRETTLNRAPEQGRSGSRLNATGQYLAAQNSFVEASNVYGQWALGSQRSATVEGVHLDGKGVVFTVSLPRTGRDPMPTAGTSPAPASLSDWDRIRQQLRGDKVETAAKPDPGQPSTADVILRVLADNGKHLRLRDDEDITVVVTFRGEGLTGYTQLDAFNTGYLAATNLAQLANDPLAPTTALAQSPASVPSTTYSAPTGHGQSARDFEVLGDLHFKQKQYQQALDAYQRITKMEPAADAKQLADAFRKLAETKIQLGQLAEAKAMLDSAMEWDKKGKNPGASSAKGDTAAKSPSPLPGKLIISASKRLLDDTGSGKVSFDDFKKGAKIDYFPFGSTK